MLPETSSTEPARDTDAVWDEVVSEFTDRLRGGEHPMIDEYAARRPDLAEEIRKLLGTVLVMEKAKAQRELDSPGRACLGPNRIERLDDFRLLNEVGRGGVGIVYQAMQESLQRVVAVNVLPTSAFFDVKVVRRALSGNRVRPLVCTTRTSCRSSEPVRWTGCTTTSCSTSTAKA